MVLVRPDLLDWASGELGQEQKAFDAFFLDGI